MDPSRDESALATATGACIHNTVHSASAAQWPLASQCMAEVPARRSAWQVPARPRATRVTACPQTETHALTATHETCQTHID